MPTQISKKKRSAEKEWWKSREEKRSSEEHTPPTHLIGALKIMLIYICHPSSYII
jgi:hypothetical protein